MKLISLEKIVQEGRKVKNPHWDRVKPLFASFCTKKEEESIRMYRQASNLSYNLSFNNYRKIFQEVKGTTMTDKISAPKFSFMLTVIHNYLISDANSALEWKPDNVEKFRFTNIKQRGAQAGWSQDGLDFYMDKLKEEINFRKEMNKKFNNVEERSDFFYYMKKIKWKEKTNKWEAIVWKFIVTRRNLSLIRKVITKTMMIVARLNLIRNRIYQISVTKGR